MQGFTFSGTNHRGHKRKINEEKVDAEKKELLLQQQQQQQAKNNHAAATVRRGKNTKDARMYAFNQEVQQQLDAWNKDRTKKPNNKIATTDESVPRAVSKKKSQQAKGRKYNNNKRKRLDKLEGRIWSATEDRLSSDDSEEEDETESANGPQRKTADDDSEGANVAHNALPPGLTIIPDNVLEFLSRGRLPFKLRFRKNPDDER